MKINTKKEPVATLTMTITRADGTIEVVKQPCTVTVKNKGLLSKLKEMFNG